MIGHAGERAQAGFRCLSSLSVRILSIRLNAPNFHIAEVALQTSGDAQPALNLSQKWRQK